MLGSAFPLLPGGLAHAAAASVSAIIRLGGQVEVPFVIGVRQKRADLASRVGAEGGLERVPDHLLARAIGLAAERAGDDVAAHLRADLLELETRRLELQPFGKRLLYLFFSHNTSQRLTIAEQSAK